MQEKYRPGNNENDNNKKKIGSRRGQGGKCIKRHKDKQEINKWNTHKKKNINEANIEIREKKIQMEYKKRKY